MYIVSTMLMYHVIRNGYHVMWLTREVAKSSSVNWIENGTRFKKHEGKKKQIPGCVCLSWKRVGWGRAASEGGSRRTTEREKSKEKSTKETTKKPIKRIRVRGNAHLALLTVSKSEGKRESLFPAASLTDCSPGAGGFLIAMTRFIIHIHTTIAIWIC